MVVVVVVDGMVAGWVVGVRVVEGKMVVVTSL